MLVPYRPEHVPHYHDWMQDPDLLEATGSEPLSMKEEIEMQQSWMNDPDKCTFIVLAKAKCVFSDFADVEFVKRNLNAMVGDVNLFLSEEETDEEQEDAHITTNEELPLGDQVHQQAELDIMIAEKSFQGQGMGREASCLMMMYASKYLGIRRFFCKINEDNLSSRALFTKLGFLQCSYAECFRQVELELKRDTVDATMMAVSELLGKTELETISCPIEDEKDR